MFDVARSHSEAARKPPSLPGMAALRAPRSFGRMTDPVRFFQTAGKGDGAGCDCGFLRSTAAEKSVMMSATGNGSMKVIAAL